MGFTWVFQNKKKMSVRKKKCVASIFLNYYESFLIYMKKKKLFMSTLSALFNDLKQ